MHRSPHPAIPGKDNITQGPVTPAPDLVQGAKLGHVKKQPLGVGGEMGEEESAAQEKEGLIDGGKEDKELHARQS